MLMIFKIKKIHRHPETLQIHRVCNTTMYDKDDSIHDEYDRSEDENITEIGTYEHYGEKIHERGESKPTETSQVLTVFNKAIHHEDDSSEACFYQGDSLEIALQNLKQIPDVA